MTKTMRTKEEKLADKAVQKTKRGAMRMAKHASRINRYTLSLTHTHINKEVFTQQRACKMHFLELSYKHSYFYLLPPTYFSSFSKHISAGARLFEIMGETNTWSNDETQRINEVKEKEREKERWQHSIHMFAPKALVFLALLFFVFFSDEL